MEYIITAVWILIELFSHYTFLSAFMPCRRTRSQCMISVLILWIILYGYSAYLLTGIIKQILTIFLIIIWSLYTFAGSWQRHILITILSCIFCGVIDIAVLYGASGIIGISYTEIAWRKLLYTAVGTIAKLLYLLLAYLVYRNRIPYGSQQIQSRWTLLTVLFPAASMVVLAFVFNGYQNSVDLSNGAFISSFVLAIANIATLYLIRTMEKYTSQEKERTLLNQQIAIQTQSISALEKSYRAQRTATHEFQHHLQTIHDLLDQEAPAEAIHYIKELQGVQTIRLLCVNTRHPIIDAVLNQKYQVATEHSIDIQYQVNDLSSLTINASLLVVLLSNLLDNAIEACLKTPGNRAICCSLLASDSIFLSIKNTSPPVKIIDGLIETSKTPKEEHGHGLITSYHVLDQLHAERTIHYEDGWFQFVAEIPNNPINL